jgi:hypothetical protein
VWHDLESVYQPYLRAVPEDAVIRSEFCNYACITKHWELAREQFKLLGSRASAEAFGAPEAMRKLRDRAESNGAGPADTP